MTIILFVECSCCCLTHGGSVVRFVKQSEQASIAVCSSSEHVGCVLFEISI